MDAIKPPKDIKNYILESIEKEEIKRAKKTFFYFISVAFLSFLGIGMFFVRLWSVFIDSNFYKYISLIFTDTDIILTYWEDSVMSLVESFPTVYVIVFLVIIVIFMKSIRIVSSINKPIFAINS